MPLSYPGVQLHQLEYFVAVARRRHFTRAAAELHVAQPSVSKQIRKLESRAGHAPVPPHEGQRGADAGWRGAAAVGRAHPRRGRRGPVGGGGAGRAAAGSPGHRGHAQPVHDHAAAGAGRLPRHLSRHRAGAAAGRVARPGAPPGGRCPRPRPGDPAGRARGHRHHPAARGGAGAGHAARASAGPQARHRGDRPRRRATRDVPRRLRPALCHRGGLPTGRLRADVRAGGRRDGLGAAAGGGRRGRGRRARHGRGARRAAARRALLVARPDPHHRHGPPARPPACRGRPGPSPPPSARRRRDLRAS